MALLAPSPRQTNVNQTPVGRWVGELSPGQLKIVTPKQKHGKILLLNCELFEFLAVVVAVQLKMIRASMPIAPEARSEKLLYFLGNLKRSTQSGGEYECSMRHSERWLAAAPWLMDDDDDAADNDGMCLKGNERSSGKRFEMGRYLTFWPLQLLPRVRYKWSRKPRELEFAACSNYKL